MEEEPLITTATDLMQACFPKARMRVSGNGLRTFDLGQYSICLAPLKEGVAYTWAENVTMMGVSVSKDLDFYEAKTLFDVALWTSTTHSEILSRAYRQLQDAFAYDNNFFGDGVVFQRLPAVHTVWLADRGVLDVLTEYRDTLSTRFPWKVIEGKPAKKLSLKVKAGPDVQLVLGHAKEHTNATRWVARGTLPGSTGFPSSSYDHKGLVRRPWDDPETEFEVLVGALNITWERLVAMSKVQALNPFASNPFADLTGQKLVEMLNDIEF